MSVLSIYDLSQVKKYLGKRVASKDGKTYTIDQTVVINEMLSHRSLTEADSVRTPIGDGTNDHDSLVSAKRGNKGEQTIRGFQSLVGIVLWVVR